jgi:glycosyltransferase involved in cell wall biosynthesis
VKTKIAFSVIMPFYSGDLPGHLHDALNSLAVQSLPADEIVLVQDGPVSSNLREVVEHWELKLPSLNWHILDVNQGLSAALNAGIAEAKHEWLARMDADDVCLQDRFEKQLNLISSDSKLSILGSWIQEYDEEMDKAKGIRRLPETDAEIKAYARWRCPFNHMTVMYRKSALESLGAYKDFGAVGDDYELWARFILNGYKAANIQEVLVKARTGEAFFKQRRRGIKYFKNELREINELYRMGLLKPWHYLFHFTTKAIVRLSPPWLVKIFYLGIRKSS